MKKICTICLVAIAIALIEVPNAKQEADAQEKTENAATPTAVVAKCPVTGNPANLAISTPTQVGPVFFCCKDCIAKYKADPGKFGEAVTAQRTILAQRPKIQVKCPVSGDPIDQKISLDKDGKKVRFCSDDCREKFAAEPEKYASALANSYTFQTLCPVMGEPIDPTVFIKLPSGESIYLCCKGCDKKLKADPAKYAQGFQKQGFAFDFTTLPKDGK